MTDKQPECRPELESGRIEDRYRGAEDESAAVPVHSRPVPWLTFPVLVARIQWHIPPEPWTAAAHVSDVEATETMLGVVDDPSTKV